MVKVELKDGSKLEVNEGSSILEVAKQISEGLARNALAGRVDGEVKDLRTPVNQDCKLEILTFDDEDGKRAFWHTASHIMAQAIKTTISRALCEGVRHCPWYAPYDL